MAPDDAPLRISTFSMSVGLMSMRRLGGGGAGIESCVCRIVVINPVIHRDAVHHEERLAIASAGGDRGESSDLYERGPARIPRARGDGNGWRLGGQSCHEILLGRILDRRRIDAASDRTKLFHL